MQTDVHARPKVRLKEKTREELQAFLDRRAPATLRHPPDSPYTIADRWAERVAENGDRPFLLYGSQSVSWAEADAWANRIAHAAHDLGLRKGDVCALIMENRPPFLVILFAMAKIGVSVALINTSSAGSVLEHALASTQAKAVIVGEEKLGAFDEIDPGALPPLWLWTDPEQPADPSARRICRINFSERAESANSASPPIEWRAGVVAADAILYMFTSGTTGLPKAARFSHMKWLIGGDVKVITMSLTRDDVFYCCLPFFHAAAIMSLVAAAISAGGAIAIRRRFSAREYWDDIRRFGATVTQYVGEICRYLVNQPARENDRDHPLRAMMGTSMNTELWHRFQDRFDVPEIYEGWGSTESNVSVTNYENRAGSVGRVPFWEKTHLRLVRYDVDNEDYIRDRNGKLIVCKPHEIGEAIARISSSDGARSGRFEGYTSAEATEAKILRSALEDGDAWWRSGDLFYEDEDGFLWFVDRIGDTFRWKSENVSTQQVADLLSDFPGIEMINVYGVKVPGQEGRAGMAAIILQDGCSFDPKGFYEMVCKRLPTYARPLFLRIWIDPVFTASGKLRKVELQRDGYDPKRFPDPLFLFDEARGTYSRYSDQLLEELDISPFQN